MKIIKLCLVIFITNLCYGQISGNLTDKQTDLPIVYANVWVKHTLKGTTTDVNGDFELEKAKVGDTLLISYLGYEKEELLAQKVNNIKLKPLDILLDEVVITRALKSRVESLYSYEDYKDITVFYLNGHYSFARFYEYKEEYKQNTFIENISLVTLSSLEKVKFQIHLIEADKNGRPTDTLLSEYIVLETNEGKNEIIVDFSDEQLIVPQQGFFVVVDRLNIKKNITSYNGKTDVLEPGIGMEKRSKEKNTWLSYGGKWLEPKQLKKFAGKNKNIAINIQLSN